MCDTRGDCKEELQAEPPPKRSHPEALKCIQPLGFSKQSQLRKPPLAWSATPGTCECFSDGKHLRHQLRDPACWGKQNERNSEGFHGLHWPQPGVCNVTPAAELPVCAAKNQDSQNSPHPRAGTSTDQRALQMHPSLHSSPENQLRYTTEV